MGNQGEGFSLIKIQFLVILFDVIGEEDTFEVVIFMLNDPSIKIREHINSFFKFDRLIA